VPFPKLDELLNALDALNFQHGDAKSLSRSQGLWHVLAFLRLRRITTPFSEEFHFSSSTEFMEVCFDVNGLVLPINSNSRAVYYEPAASQGKNPTEYFRNYQGPRQTYLNRIYTGLVGAGKKQPKLFSATGTSLPVTIGLEKNWIDVLRSASENETILDKKLHHFLTYVFRFGFPLNSAGETVAIAKLKDKELIHNSDAILNPFPETKEQLATMVADFFGLVDADFNKLFPAFSALKLPLVSGKETILGKELSALIKERYLDKENKLLDPKVEPSGKTKDTTDRATGGYNKIFYGAPGTGKTHKVDAITSEPIFRTVFHPDTQNSDFVGALKPQSKDDNIQYVFSPGPFALAIAHAFQNPSSVVFLVIEELNRAPAAAVFGELFLLLDRLPNGTGKYSVNFSTQEFKSWFEDQINASIEKLYLPSNLSIIATMNSADQGVFPLDTAFRRRWEQEYIPINYSDGPIGALRIDLPNGKIEMIEWQHFGDQLNNFLLEQAELQIPEDRLLGQWFISEHEFVEDGSIPSKILLYLWDDLLRHQGRDFVFLPDIRTIGTIFKRINEKKPIFTNEFLGALLASSEAE
jgi:hypothetical protein